MTLYLPLCKFYPIVKKKRNLLSDTLYINEKEKEEKDTCDFLM